MAFSRRDFLSLGLLRGLDAGSPSASAAHRVAEPEPAGFLRPPGALAEPEFLAACMRCDACIDACPRDAIRRAEGELGAVLAGTPVIVPEEQPCWMCRDLPCIPVCEPGALTPLAAPSDARMGTIRIRFERCYSAQGSICEVCAERCPVSPKAVRVPMGTAPELDPERCTGCAVCAWLCPADAIDVIAPVVAG